MRKPSAIVVLATVALCSLGFVRLQLADAAIGATESQDRGISDPNSPIRKPTAAPEVKVANTSSELTAVEVSLKFASPDFLHVVYENRTNADQVVTIVLKNINPTPVELRISGSKEGSALPEIPVNGVAIQSVSLAKGQALFVRGIAPTDKAAEKDSAGVVAYTILLSVPVNLPAPQPAEDSSKMNGFVVPTQ